MSRSQVTGHVTANVCQLSSSFSAMLIREGNVNNADDLLLLCYAFRISNLSRSCEVITFKILCLILAVSLAEMFAVVLSPRLKQMLFLTQGFKYLKNKTLLSCEDRLD